jgi:hypothetical protein
MRHLSSSVHILPNDRRTRNAVKIPTTRPSGLNRSGLDLEDADGDREVKEWLEGYVKSRAGPEAITRMKGWSCDSDIVGTQDEPRRGQGLGPSYFWPKDLDSLLRIL